MRLWRAHGWGLELFDRAVAFGRIYPSQNGWVAKGRGGWRLEFSSMRAAEYALELRVNEQADKQTKEAANE